ncbi:hypothetical protein BDA99DRAFT_541110 [Phascolomyces articulosus]|uniref:Uncharacterized protein n=1 Tax=Phascolomyces articulosus TaxID=60185 RepID=A0AAD5JSK5_9FUNG|nr:hypothetical protein BDA99DRAFT_541110 [Phascolomyces articulosus]
MIFLSRLLKVLVVDTSSRIRFEIDGVDADEEEVDARLLEKLFILLVLRVVAEIIEACKLVLSNIPLPSSPFRYYLIDPECYFNNNPPVIFMTVPHQDFRFAWIWIHQADFDYVLSNPQQLQDVLTLIDTVLFITIRDHYCKRRQNRDSTKKKCHRQRWFAESGSKFFNKLSYQQIHYITTAIAALFSEI